MNKIKAVAISAALMTTILMLVDHATKPKTAIELDNMSVCIEEGEYRIGANTYKVCKREMKVME